MPLKLLPLQPLDVEAWAKLDYLSFRETIGQVLWTCDPSHQTFALMAQERLEELQVPDKVHLKVVDTNIDPETPIAFANWHIFRSERSQEELDNSFAIPDMYPERNKDAVLDFWSRLFEKKKEVMGRRAHIYLEMLATHPNHQKRGAGSLLMQWAVEEADRLGLEVFVEASPPGRFLYSKFDFDTVEEVLFEGAPFGVDVDELTRLMIRRPKPYQTRSVTSQDGFQES